MLTPSVQKSSQENHEEIGAMRDAWLMLEGLNDLDPLWGIRPVMCMNPWMTF